MGKSYKYNKPSTHKFGPRSRKPRNRQQDRYEDYTYEEINLTPHNDPDHQPE